MAQSELMQSKMNLMSFTEKEKAVLTFNHDLAVQKKIKITEFFGKLSKSNLVKQLRSRNFYFKVYRKRQSQTLGDFSFFITSVLPNAIGCKLIVFNLASYANYLNGSKLYNSIGHINFVCLQELVLKDCQLTTIQPIEWMQIPQIKVISLVRNDVYSLKPFRKTSFKKLQEVNFEFNHFREEELTYFRKMRNPWVRNQQDLIDRHAIRDQRRHQQISGYGHLQDYYHQIQRERQYQDEKQDGHLFKVVFNDSSLHGPRPSIEYIENKQILNKNSGFRIIQYIKYKYSVMRFKYVDEIQVIDGEESDDYL